VRDLVADPETAVLGTHRFSIIVGGACSGIEGAGLMLVFSTGWLWLFRRELRFPQALVLVPASIAVMWLLNGVRLAALILVGNAGAPQIAMGGFHSQAGWISFNLVAVGVLLAAGRVSWWRREPVAAEGSSRAAGNPTAKYLVPLIAILVSAMIARAASAGFEWLYPLRLLAAAGALWCFRVEYRTLDWRCGWFAPLVGTIVFAVWMGFDALRGSQPSNGIAALETASAFMRISWLVCRTVAAVVTVPIAEELAFRGFLIRRLIAADFESLGPRTFTWFAVLLSSLVFGLLHGHRWIEGTIAGILYAVALLRRGRIGEAVTAHATTNALTALMVLARGDWYLW
jgi:exosortase E/protease (VPEID-CTERM system)